MNFIKRAGNFKSYQIYNLHRYKKMSENMKKSPEKFEGLYQAVLLLSQDAGKKNTALKEWRIRSEKLFPDSELAKFCKRFAEGEYLEKHSEKTAKLLVKCFEKAGFTYDIPDAEKHLIVNEKQALAYRDLGGREIEEGDEITVLSPAWYCGDKIIEHGLTGGLL